MRLARTQGGTWCGGLKGGDEARIWLANEWAEANRGFGPDPAPALSVTPSCTGLRPGLWDIAWIDPRNGDVVARETRRAGGDGLDFEVGDLTHERCPKLRRVGRH